MYVCTLKHKYHTGAFCSIQVLRALGRISVRVFSTHSPPPNCSRRTTMRPLEFCPRLNSLSPSSIVTTTNQLQETPAGNPCRKTPRAENSSMLHTEEVLTQPRLLQHGGNAKHTHDRLPMDSLTRLFGSPVHSWKPARAGQSQARHLHAPFILETPSTRGKTQHVERADDLRRVQSWRATRLRGTRASAALPALLGDELAARLRSPSKYYTNWEKKFCKFFCR